MLGNSCSPQDGRDRGSWPGPGALGSPEVEEIPGWLWAGAGMGWGLSHLPTAPVSKGESLDHVSYCTYISVCSQVAGFCDAQPYLFTPDFIHVKFYIPHDCHGWNGSSLRLWTVFARRYIFRTYPSHYSPLRERAISSCNRGSIVQGEKSPGRPLQILQYPTPALLLAHPGLETGSLNVFLEKG